jgi:hypothetical protein
MDPISTASTDWKIARTAGEISRKLRDLTYILRDPDSRQQLCDILSQMHELIAAASDLEEENRDLRNIVTNMYCDLLIDQEQASP